MSPPQVSADCLPLVTFYLRDLALALSLRLSTDIILTTLWGQFQVQAGLIVIKVSFNFFLSAPLSLKPLPSGVPIKNQENAL